MERNLERIFYAPLDCILDNTSIVQPDLVWVANDRREQISQRRVKGAPTLVVEIGSPSTTRIDRGRKMQPYARFGVPRYWIDEPDLMLIDDFDVVNGTCEIVGQAAPPQSITLSSFPGLTIPLAEVFA